MAGSLGSPDSLNRYLYAKDDPVNVVDPSGRQSWGDIFLRCVTLPFFALIAFAGGALQAIGVAAAGIYIVLGLSAPAWAIWAGIIGAFLYLGVALFCAALATLAVLHA